MIRLLTIAAAAVAALAVSAAPASAAKCHSIQGEDQTYLIVTLDNVSITSYQLGVLDTYGEDQLP